MFDNVAGLGRVLVKAYQDIEASYVPYLQSRFDPPLNIVRASAQQCLSGELGRSAAVEEPQHRARGRLRLVGGE